MSTSEMNTKIGVFFSLYGRRPGYLSSGREYEKSAIVVVEAFISFEKMYMYNKSA